MADRKTFDRRFLAGAFVKAGLAMGINGVLGADTAEAEEKPTKMLTVDLNSNSVSAYYRKLVEQIESIPESAIPLWDYSDVPTVFLGPRIIINEELQCVKGVQSEGKTVYATPNSGIATPAESNYPRILLYGHSRWDFIEQVFRKIQSLETGDLVSVLNPRYPIPYWFLVDGFELRSEDSLRDSSELELVLQTTAMDKGEWLLDEKLVTKKADPSKIDGWHANFYVYAKPFRIKVPA